MRTVESSDKARATTQNTPKMANNNEKQSTKTSTSSPESNQENNKRPKKKRSEAQKDNETPVDESSMSEKQLLEFYKTKCALIENQLDKHREDCSQLETKNFELTTKIDELREVVAKSNEVKAGLEEMGIDVEKYLDLIDDEESNA